MKKEKLQPRPQNYKGPLQATLCQCERCNIGGEKPLDEGGRGE